MNFLKNLYIFHIIFGIFFSYLGFKKQTSEDVYKGLLVLGVLVLLYHAYHLIEKINNNMYSSYNLINLIHILLVAPLLIYIGYFKDKTNIYALDLLFIIGIGMTVHFIIKLKNIL